MLLSGILIIFGLASSGYYWEELVKIASEQKDITEYFDHDVPELGIRPQNPRKVLVEVYYETLCPDTRHLIRAQIYPVWEELSHIMDIHWKPYGKAQHWEDEQIGYAFNCHNGPLECVGNMVHACSIKYIRDEAKLADFIHCMIEDNYEPKEIGKYCAEMHEVNWDPIHNCTTSKEGTEILAAHGDDTHSLRPKMTFVPHVVMNGRYIKPSDTMNNFKHILCSAYRGERPDACIDRI